jgi:hypothetical protein
MNEYRYLAGVPRLGYYEAAWLLTLWRHSDEYGWLDRIGNCIFRIPELIVV